MIARLVLSGGRFKTADSSVRVAFVVRFHILLCDRSTDMVLTLCGPNLSSLQRGFSMNNAFKMGPSFET